MLTDEATVHRTVVGTYQTHEQAEDAISFLADNGFPVERTGNMCGSCIWQPLKASSAWTKRCGF